MIKNILKQFDILIAGNSLDFEVEKRLFNIAVFVSFLVSILSLIINANLDMPEVLQVIIAFGSIFLIYIYINSRILHQFFIWTYIIVALLILSGSWLLNEGPNGSINYLYVLTLFVFLSITNHNKHFIISFLVIGNLVILYLISYYFPEWVLSYPSESIRNADLLLTVGYVIGFSALIFSSLRRNFENEKKTIEIQKTELELQNKHITDSIQYAKEIQQGLLQDTETIRTYFPESFVFWQPKDIVSGDFYFFQDTGHQKNKVVCALADCTGHGVPGALITILGLSLLNEIILQHPEFSASEILDQLRFRIKVALRQGKRSVENRDGMDMALCILEKQTNVLQFAGANRPIYLVRAGELIEFKPNRMPIGVHYHDNKAFNNHNIQLKDGDIIYLLTDGFADQFGGNENRKFFLANLKKTILLNSNLPMEKQYKIMKKTFQDWKGANEQTDDILVIGFKI